MTWRSFVDYVLMLAMGKPDSIARNYQLNRPCAKPGVMLDKAYARMGFDQPNTPRPFIVPTVAQHMRDCGLTAPKLDMLGDTMREWYIWDRIRAGELRQWPLKPVEGDNPLI